MRPPSTCGVLIAGLGVVMFTLAAVFIFAAGRPEAGLFALLAVLALLALRGELAKDVAQEAAAPSPVIREEALEALVRRHPRLRVRDGLRLEGRFLDQEARVEVAPHAFQATVRVPASLPSEMFDTYRLHGHDTLPAALRTLEGRAVIARLGRWHDLLQLGPDGLVLRDVPPTLEDLERTLELLARLARLLPRVPAAPPSPQVTAAPRERAAATTCPYCRGDLLEADAAACDACGTPHHALCFEEHGGCTVTGCGGARTRPVRSVDSGV